MQQLPLRSRNEIVVDLPMGHDGPAAKDRQIMHIRRPGPTRAGAMDEVEPLAGASLHELSQSEEGAARRARLMLGVHLLQAENIRIQRRQHGPQHSRPRLEPERI